MRNTIDGQGKSRQAGLPKHEKLENPKKGRKRVSMEQPPRLTHKQALLCCKCATEEKEEEIMKAKKELSRSGIVPFSFVPGIQAAYVSNETFDQVSGYRGVAFLRNGNEIILAHRGLQFEEAGNLAAAYMIVLERDPAFITSKAVEFTTSAIAAFRAKKPNGAFDVIHVGFSLGGFMSAYCGGISSVQFGKQHYSMCFDPPGAKGAIEQYYTTQRNVNVPTLTGYISVFFVSPNLVNMSGAHVGTNSFILNFFGIHTYHVQMTRFLEKGVDLGVLNWGVIKNTLAVLDSTMKTHNQPKLLRLLEKKNLDDFEIWPVTSWPKATNALIPVDGTNGYSHMVDAWVGPSPFTEDLKVILKNNVLFHCVPQGLTYFFGPQNFPFTERYAYWLYVQNKFKSFS
jgi:hypothetical protein